jgi:general secretion pathway protein I
MTAHVVRGTRRSLAGMLHRRVLLTVAADCGWAPRSPMRRRQGGFTLVEVIAAIAILSIALGSLMTMIGNALRQTGQADRMAEAGTLAQSLLARFGPELPLGERQDAGRFDSGYHWRLSSQRFGDSNDRQQWPLNAYKVSVEVGWQDGFRERSYTLTTLRLGPKEAAR